MTGRLDSIQLMRGLAATMVFAFHLVVTLDRYSPAELRRWIEFGQAGVDLFFVISGFVMAHSTRDLSGGRDAAGFLLRRFWRIAPLLYVVASVHIALGFAAGWPPSLARILNCFTILPAASTSESFAYALTPAWTLGFEAAFYLLVASAVAMLARWRLPALILILAALPFLPVAWPAALSPYADGLMLEFAFGVGLYMLWRRNLIDPRLALPAGLLALAGMALTFPEVPSAGARPFAWGIPAALTFVAMLSWRPGQRGAGPILLWLGSASYSLYLCHVVVFDAAAPLLVPVLPLPLLALALAALGMSATWWLHSRVERPLLHWRPWSGRHARAETAVPIDRTGAAVELK